MGNRAKKLAAVIAVVVVGAGLVAVGGTSAAAAPVVQDGPHNYAGPGPCPLGTTDCLVTTGDVNVVQSAPSTGSNTADCRGASCIVEQNGSNSAAKPPNTASCTNATSAATSEQTCDVKQSGGNNTINADFSATPSVGGLINLATVSQASEQRFLTSQTGDTNTLNVKGNIAQSATSTFDATTPVSHNQRTLVHAVSTMTAAVRNVAGYDLDRSQTSSATGATPVQLQDSAAGSESDGAKFGLGNVRLIAKSAGTSAIKVRADDNKSQGATSANLGPATQTQGYTGGGWLIDLSGTDTAVANADGSPDVDLGSQSSNGINKNWTQTASGLLGATITKNQAQNDGIKIPVIGQSPKKVSMGLFSRLRTDAGGRETCDISTEGHAQISGAGRLTCDMQAGTKVQNPTISFNAATWKVSVFCQINSDFCPGGEISEDVDSIQIAINGEDKKSGVIPVTVLGQPDDGDPATVDDASTVDPSTLCFGEPDPAFASERDCSIANRATLADADNDGDLDLKMHFEAAQTGLDPDDSTGCLHGRTYSGQQFEGCAPLPKG